MSDEAPEMMLQENTEAVSEKKSKREKKNLELNSRPCPASYLPLHVIVRWAFGGFSSDELETRLKSRVKDITLIASVCHDIRTLLWTFACSVSMQEISERSLT